MTGLSTAQAAALLGVSRDAFRKQAQRARRRGDDWRLPPDQWPDKRTPLYDPARLPITRQENTVSKSIVTLTVEFDHGETAQRAGITLTEVPEWVRDFAEDLTEYVRDGGPDPTVTVQEVQS